MYLKNGPIPGTQSLRRAMPWLLVSLCGTAVLAGGTAPAGPDPGNAAGEDVALDDAALAAAAGGDDLLVFQEMPVVVSAGRQRQRINQSSVPVSIITADDIRFSGQTSIPELLRYVPGMAVHRMDRNTMAVGVRGLHDQYSDRTLVLVNGRNTGSPGYGASDLTRLPVALLDVDRVEVVRGPGGAMWGANAFNGVINVLTKKPEDSPGGAVSARINTFGDTFSQFRWGAKSGGWAWKIAGSFEELETSEDAIAHDDFSSRDFRRGGILDSEGVYSIDADTKLRFGAAITNHEQGPGEFLSFTAPEDARLQQTRFFAKLEMKPSDTTEGYVQWFSNLEDVNLPSAITFDGQEHDLETQWTIRSGVHTFMFGGNIRFSVVDQTITKPEDIVLAGSPYRETTAGVFVGDRWEITDRLALDGQLRGDSYSGTGLDWSARFAALYALDKDKRHIGRLAFAKAFRAPTPIVRDIFTQRLPLPSPPFTPNLFGVTTFAEPELENEELYSLEAGYTGVLTEGLTLRVDGYYQDYQDLIGGEVLSTQPVVYKIRNYADATAWGGEAELAYSADRWTGSLWYSQHHLTLHPEESSTRSLLVPEHNVGAKLRWEFMTGTYVQAAYRYTEGTKRDSYNYVIGVTHSLDLTLTRTFWDGRADAQLGVLDLLDSTGDPLAAAGSVQPHPTPGRTVFAGVTLRF